MNTPDLVLVGNLLVDDLVFEDGTTRMGQPGGSLLHAALASSAWGARVGCVSVLGSDYPRAILALLQARGVSLEGVVQLGAPGVRVWLLYEGGVRRMVGRLGRPTHDEVSPSSGQVPATWRSARAMHVAPMPFERQRELVEAFGDGARVLSIDPLVPITEDSLEEWRAVLSLADVLFVSQDDLLLPGARERPEALLRALVVGRLRYVVHKRGSSGGALYDAQEGRLRTWSACAAKEVDPTGAGDAFAGAFMAALVAGAHVDDAIARGAATASFAVEGMGADALRVVSSSELHARRRACVVSSRPA